MPSTSLPLCSMFSGALCQTGPSRAVQFIPFTILGFTVIWVVVHAFLHSTSCPSSLNDETRELGGGSAGSHKHSLTGL